MTTKTNTQVMQQALAALEYHTEQTRPIERTCEAMDALKAAIAQPLQPATPLGYINRKDIERLSNYKATIWPGENEIDAVPVYLEPAAQHTAHLLKALRAAQRAIGSMKQTAETAGAGGDKRMLQEACESISNEGLIAFTAINAVIFARGAK